MDSSVLEVSTIKKRLEDTFGDFGFEFYPFLIKWYHEKVANAFKLDYSEDTVGFVVVSTPDMFEKTFLPYVHSQELEADIRDPIDQCVANTFNNIKNSFPEYKIDTLQDYEQHHTRRPKILMQTVSHISGAAYFYQRNDIVVDPWDKKKKMFGVCIHPNYGGWFALRGVIILSNLKCPNLPRSEPRNIVEGDDLKIELLERYNYRWEDWTFRDIISVKAQYSEAQKLYFATLPQDRKALLKNIPFI